jgi:hypothetical protein
LPIFIRTITQAAKGVPSGAVGVRMVYKISGYYPAYDDTATGHGFYIDELEINELEGTATSATEVIVDDDIIPSIVTFMGNIYIFGFDKNIKLMSGEAIDFLPSYPENAKYACVHQNRDRK